MTEMPNISAGAGSSVSPLLKSNQGALFDKAGAMGQRYAQMEAKGMRMQGAADAQQARYAKQCASRGGVADGPVCEVGGMAIDPY